MAHGIARQRHERVILFIVARPGLGTDVAKLHHAAAVRHAGGRPNHHGHPHLRRKCERRHGHILHFLRGGGFEAGKPEQAGILPIILLVLAGEHARVVGAVHYEAPTDAEIRQRAERIGGDVEADVLHGGQTVQAAMDAPATASIATFSLVAKSMRKPPAPCNSYSRLLTSEEGVPG